MLRVAARWIELFCTCVRGRSRYSFSYYYTRGPTTPEQLDSFWEATPPAHRSLVLRSCLHRCRIESFPLAIRALRLVVTHGSDRAWAPVPLQLTSASAAPVAAPAPAPAAAPAAAILNASKLAKETLIKAIMDSQVLARGNNTEAIVLPQPFPAWCFVAAYSLPALSLCRRPPTRGCATPRRGCAS